MDLETILQNFGYKKVFKKDGTLSVDGNKAYGNLIEIIYNLQFIGVISNANEIIDKLDKILDENWVETFSAFIFSTMAYQFTKN